MKKIKIILVVFVSIITFNLSAQTTHPNFIMFWQFVDASGTNIITNQEVCDGGTVYLKNLSTSDNYGIGNTLNTGYYKFYIYPGLYQIDTVHANNWHENDVFALTLPVGMTIPNIRVQHIGPGTSPAFTVPYLSEHHTKNLTNHILSVNAGPDTTVCPFQGVVLEGTGTGSSFNWTPSGGSNNPTLPIFFSSTTVNTLTTSKSYNTTSQGILTCTASDQMTVFVNPSPSIHLNDYQLCDGDPLPVLNGGPSPVAYQWNYTPTDSITDTIVGFGQYLNTATFGYGTYTLTVYNTYGCASSGSAIVELSSSAASNLDASFNFNTVNSGSQTVIDVESYETGTHHWMLFNSDAIGNIGLFPIEQITTTSPTHVFSGQPLNQFYKIVHDFKQSPCNDWATDSRLTYQSSKIIHVYPNPVGVNKKFFMKLKDKDASGVITIVDMVTRQTVYTSRIEYGTTLETTFRQASIYVVNFQEGNNLHTETVIVR